LAFQAAAYTFTDALNQSLQLVFVRRFDSVKAGWLIVAIHIDAVRVSMYSYTDSTS
jgi:hypothetical protein